ncbi:MAG: protein phosphatase 2C domain-containing protein, partial [Proteobacteria bacterium]|nr:protein phosphatase 2C domain-containing protein [Pseudomonadota bacterium]
TRRICLLVHRRFDDIMTTDSRRMIVDDLKGHLEAKGREVGADLGELASTLLFVGVKDGVYLAGHLGDGVIGVLRQDRVEVLSPPKRGEFANTTYFVTQAESDVRLRLYAGRTDEADGFILMSDGAAESLFDRARKVMAPAVGRILGWLDEHSPPAVTRALYYNLNSIIIEKTNDDCSIAVMKLVRKTIEELRAMDRQSLKDFLGVADNAAAADWIKILSAFAEGCSGVEDIARRIGLPAELVRRSLLNMQENHLLDRITTG